jgi:phosphatidylserine/phosphatidylglycerophosphate/cardiolipin synthase-like enzyme
MNLRAVIGMVALSVVVGWSWTVSSFSHQDRCHRLHSCPSDHGTYVCGDKGRCDQCTDNPYCAGGKPRATISTVPAPAPLSPVSRGTTSPSEVTVCFTPGGHCTEAIVKVLGEARGSRLVQAHSFTSAPIAKVLLEAHKRGVQVQVILDKSQRTKKYSSADFLAIQGVPTMIDAEHAIALNKIIIIDGETIITGRFNFTKAAQEKHAENVLLLRDPALAAQYTTN